MTPKEMIELHKVMYKDYLLYKESVVSSVLEFERQLKESCKDKEPYYENNQTPKSKE